MIPEVKSDGDILVFGWELYLTRNLTQIKNVNKRANIYNNLIKEMEI